MPLRLIVFGIDGASHTVTRKLMQEGKLPFLSSLGKNGLSGSLKSTFPPHTAPGWASMFTGVEPGKHGIFQFWCTQNPDYIPRLMSVHDFGWEPIWRTLERHGLAVGVVNLPMSHPPQPLKDGFMISWPLSTTLHYSEPKTLIQELARAGLHYHSDIVTMYRGQENYLALASSYIQGRTQTLKYLLKQYSVEALFVVYTEVDRVSHHYWGENEEPSRDVEDVYIAMDYALGQLIQEISEDTLLIVASDHGFGRCRSNLNIHSVLEEAGLMKTQLVPAERGADASKTKRDDLAAADKVRWFSSSRSYFRTVDWSRTYAYMPTPGCFGINLNRKNREQHGIVPDSEIPALQQEISHLFADLRHPSGGTAFEVVPRNQIYHGHCAENAPDLILVPHQWDIMPHTDMESEIWSPPTQQAIHREDGILFAQGPHIPKGMQLNAGIEDITPFILAQLGLPIPENSTGNLLIEPPHAVSREPSRERWMENNDVVLNSYENSLLQKRLSDLGYM